MASFRIGSRPTGLARRIQRIQTHVLSFHDHQGHASRLVFQGLTSSPLPPLYAFVIYFTHAEASPDNVDAAALFNAINGPSEPLAVRLELFFLPNATAEDCITHYHSEKAKRGDYSAQIAALDSNKSPSPSPAVEHGTGIPGVGLGLPGFVPSYVDYFHTYHGLLFLCTERDWRSGRREMCRVLFDPCSVEEWTAWRSESEPEVQPATQLQWLPVDQDSPVFDPQVTGTVSQEMHVVSNLQRQNVTTEPWQDAVQKGWTRWP